MKINLKINQNSLTLHLDQYVTPNTDFLGPALHWNLIERCAKPRDDVFDHTIPTTRKYLSAKFGQFESEIKFVVCQEEKFVSRCWHVYWNSRCHIRSWVHSTSIRTAHKHTYTSHAGIGSWHLLQTSWWRWTEESVRSGVSRLPILESFCNYFLSGAGSWWTNMATVHV